MNTRQKRMLGAWCGATAVALVAIAGFVWSRWASPTDIAFVNYPEYMLAPLMDQEFPSSIRPHAVKWTDKSGDELSRYSMVIFFGMGLNFTDEQTAIIKSLRDKPIYTTASTRQETALNTLTEAQTTALTSYLGNLDKENFRSMLAFIRRDIDGKRLFAPAPPPAKAAVSNRFFHADGPKDFKSVTEYLQWYRDEGNWKDGAPLVCLMAGMSGADCGTLLAALESKGLNVIGVNGMSRQLPPDVVPDAIVCYHHGRFSMMDPDGGVKYLKDNNILLFSPISVGQDYREFLKDQRGMTGGILSQSIIMPEFDGGVAPYVTAALYPNKRGLLAYKPIPDRIDKYATLIAKTLALRRKPNFEKRIAIIYYKGPGKNAMEAGGLEVGPSLLNTLRTLKAAGYDTGELPEDASVLEKMVQERGAVFGDYAKGAQADFLANHREPVVIRREEYREWCLKNMYEDLWLDLEKAHGAFPEEMRLGCLRFGKVILMPQGAAGTGESEETVVHGVKQLPPHSYIAAYMYLKHGYEADALMHFGTHGSLEFTPWKQVALSSYDWPDILMGCMPHYYLYVISNIGEAVIAKRRSYATMLSHLTAPFMNAEINGPLLELDEKMHHYETADNPMLKAEYAKGIVAAAKALHIDTDLKLTLDEETLTDEQFRRIHEHLHEIELTKVNRGVYVIGRPYSAEEADETARLMTIDAVADRLFQEDIKAGKVTESQKDDRIWFDREYLSRARTAIEEAFRKANDYSGQVSVQEAETHPAKPKEASAMPPSGMPSKMREAIERRGGMMKPEEMPPAMREAMKRMGLDPDKALVEMQQAMAKGDGGAGQGRTGGVPPMGGTGRRGMGNTEPVPSTKPAEEIAVESRQALLDSTQRELDAMLKALGGGYMEAGPGGDPVGNPESVPTGKNLYGINPERTPTRESFQVGKKLAEALIEAKRKSAGVYPKKVAFSLWGGEFIRTQGTNIGEILWLLGVEPIWDTRGRVQDVRLVPMEKLNRPRIDVVVQTSGQFRGVATSRMRLIDKAVKLAAQADDGSQENYVREGSLLMARSLTKSGMSPAQARELADSRIFGGADGNFGTGIQGGIQSSDQWSSTDTLAEQYIRNMGAIYTEGHWGENHGLLFRAALKNTDTVVQSRSSNTWGPLSLDHVYEFTGGISMAVRSVTGKEADAYFNDLRTPGRARIQEAGEAVMVEARSTVLNEKYLKEMMEEGPGAASSFAAVLQNTFGWETTRPGMIDDHLWEDYKSVFLDDSLNLGMKEYFEGKNPYALQEMTGVMLEAIRKGFWKASPETAREIARRHGELVEIYGAGCSGYVCDNTEVQKAVAKQIDNPAKYQAEIRRIREAAPGSRRTSEVTGQRMKRQDERENRKEVSSSRRAITIWSILCVCVAALFFGGRRRRKR